MEQVIARILDRRGYTIDEDTFAEFDGGEWAARVQDKETDEDYVAIGKDEQFVILESVQPLREWMKTHS